MPTQSPKKVVYREDNEELSELNQINIIPLVDVMLVLLTIVLTTATFIVNGSIPVELAKSASANPATTAPVVITLTQDNQLYLNEVKIEALATALEPLDKKSLVILRADGQTSLTRFVALSDDIKQLGFTQVSLEVKKQ